MTKTNKKFLIAVLTALMVVVTTLACFIGFNAQTKQAKAEEMETVTKELEVGDTLLNKTFSFTMCALHGCGFEVTLNDGRTFINSGLHTFGYTHSGDDYAYVENYIEETISGTDVCGCESISLMHYEITDVMYFVSWYAEGKETQYFTEDNYVTNIDVYEGCKIYLTYEREPVKTVENQETFLLQVGDTIAGKTLVFNPTTNISGSSITLSNGARLNENLEILEYYLDDIECAFYGCETRGTVDEDGIADFYYEIENEMVFDGSSWSGPDEIIINFEGLTVTEINIGNSAPIRYFITNPVTEEPEEPETEVPDVPVEEEPDVPADEPTEDKDQTTKEPDNKKDDVIEDEFDFEVVLDWIEENLAFVIITSIIAIILIASIVKKKRG